MPKGIYKHHSNQGFQKGYKQTKEHIEKLQQTRLGKHHSEETIKKMRKAHKGNTHGFQKGQHSSLSTEFKNGQTGSKSKSWKGGKYKTQNRWFIYNPKHPFAQNRGYIKQSRLVAEKCLGRYLTKIEVIHHINENKSDDRPENLYLFETLGEHTSYHMRNNKPILKSNLINLI